MAQSKKKHKQSKKSNHFSPQKSKTYKLLRHKTSGDFDIDWTLFTAASDEKTFSRFMTTPDSISYKSIRKMYLNLKSETGIQDYIDKTASLKSKLEKQFDIWLSDCTDANPVLNKYNTDAARNTIIDTLDFRDYINPEIQNHKDLLPQALLELQENQDITMLWSTQEFVDIKMTDSLSYRVHRVGYDYLNNAMRYCIYEYIKFRISDTEIIEIPTLQIVATVDIGRIKNKQTMYTGSKSASLEPYKKTPFQNAILEEQASIMSDPNDFTSVRIGVMGANCLLNTESHLELHHSHWGKTEYRNIRDRIREFCADLYTVMISKEKQAMHQITVVSTVISAIIIANSYLKKHQLSKPVNSKITHEAEIILQNHPERKTRILGDNIRLTSSKRPQSPDMEKIIKYHTPEWTRKSHLRRLKSGKIIEIPAGKCRRKCVDMDNIKSNLPEKAVDYIIKPDAKS